MINLQPHDLLRHIATESERKQNTSSMCAMEIYCPGPKVNE